MQSLHNLLKTLLIALSLSLFACEKAPPFPEISPRFQVPTKNKVVHCSTRLQDEVIIFSCPEINVKPFDPIAEDKRVTLSLEEFQNVLDWSDDMRKFIKDKKCGG